MRLSLLAACVLGATTITAPALRTPDARGGSADDLALARRHKDALEWDQALAAAERALADGDADPARVVELHQLAGELAAGLDRDDVAIAHFEQLLALAPDRALPAGTSPRITARFDVARARARARERPAFAAHAERDGAGLAVVIDRDPLAMAVGARARYRDDAGLPRELVVRGAGRLAVPVPAGAFAIELAAIDVHGNALWIGAPPASLEAAPAATPASTPPTAHAWGGTTGWAIAAGGALAIAGIATWQLRSAQDDWNTLHADPGHHDYSELTAVETRGRRWALTANIAYGAAAATGAVAIVLAIRELRRDDADAAPAPAPSTARAALHVAPVITPDQLGVALDGRF